MPDLGHEPWRAIDIMIMNAFQYVILTLSLCDTSSPEVLDPGFWCLPISGSISTEMAQFAEMNEFQHRPLRRCVLRDADDNEHGFHFRSLLLDDQALA